MLLTAQFRHRKQGIPIQSVLSLFAYYLQPCMLKLLSKSSIPVMLHLSWIYFWFEIWRTNKSCTWKTKFHTFKCCRVCGPSCFFVSWRKKKKKEIGAKACSVWGVFLCVNKSNLPTCWHSSHANDPHLLGEGGDVIHTLASAPAHVTFRAVFLTFASSSALPLIPFSFFLVSLLLLQKLQTVSKLFLHVSHGSFNVQ